MKDEIPRIHFEKSYFGPSLVRREDKLLANSANDYQSLINLRNTFSGRIALVTGCFDYKLHRGHDFLLEQAKGYVPNGVLVVGVNHDKSVRRLKGANRPVDTHYVRQERIIKHDCVDFAYIFDDDTAVHAMIALIPDVFVTFFEGNKLRDKPEIVHAVENSPRTAIRIVVDYQKDDFGVRVSTSRLLGDSKL